VRLVSARFGNARFRMTKISIELVPRSTESLEADLRLLQESFSTIRTVNIPDLLRFHLRSWQACRIASNVVPRAIPHLRAMDFASDDVGRLVEYLEDAGLDEILIIRGDPPQDLGHRMFATRSVDLIRGMRKAMPGARIYSAIDPYRASVQAEMEHAARKIDAGSDGFFTQPFFDLRLMDIWAELLHGSEVYWGVSSATTMRTRRYWEAKIGAFFPGKFEPTVEWNQKFAGDVLRWAEERDTNLYFMPMRTDIMTFLGSVIGSPRGA
jgi:methylenetetrahydrofolate reductase (NADPH)